ncbi:MAG: HAD-IA family hydrolase [Cytophagaceae bacterium]|nr:HAD-IA family hydrolase [Cytophagaceae bacterium]
MKKLFIFDMDGVLIDSEPIYHHFHPVFFRERLGITLTNDEVDRFTGVSSREIYAHYKALHNLPETTDYYVNQEYDLLMEHFANLPELPPIAGIPALLETLRGNGFRLVLSSSNQRRMVQLCLKRSGLESFFENVLSGEDVPRAKPDPEIFSRQAVHVGVSPDECVVIEDSTNGVKAAKAAGMFCIGFYNPNSGNQDLSPADWQVDAWTSPVVERMLTMGQNILV